MSRITR